MALNPPNNNGPTILLACRILGTSECPVTTGKI